MSSFKDTSNWKQKDKTTLAYSYDVDGKRHDDSSEKEPNSVLVQLDRLSILNETSWRLKDDKEPESETGYFTREFITAFGGLEGSRIHAITLDKSENEVFSQMDVSIYPVELEKLKRASTVEELSILCGNEKPEEGWLRDEIGRIDYHRFDQYFDRSSLSARLYLSQAKFDDLVRAIKADNIRSARLNLFVDVYQFKYEGMGVGMPHHYFNYAILCEDDGRVVRGHTKARLQEVLLEWSPKLEVKTSGRRDEPGEVDYLEPDMPVEKDIEKVVARLARDVQAIRGRMDIFYQAAIVVIAILVLRQVFDWIGF